jgi:hypothetical protein
MDFQNIGSGTAGSGAAYDPALTADRNFQINADHLHQIFDPLVGTNVANGTYYHYLDMFSYRRLDAQLVLETTGSAGTITVKVYGANEETAAGGDIPADEWVDIGLGAYGAASWAGPAGSKTLHLLGDTSTVTAGLKWVRFEVVVAGGSSNVSYDIFAKRLY